MNWIKKIYTFHLVRSFFLLACTLFVSISTLFTGSAFAWWGESHKEITRSAVQLLPKSLQEALIPQLNFLITGSVEPDINRIDNHKVYISGVGVNQNRPNDGANIALVRFARQAETMIKAGEPMDKVAFVLGQAVHFIEDINVPLHTVWGETQRQHDDYEGVAYLPNWVVEKHTYSGFVLIRNYNCFAYEIAERSNIYASLTLKYPPPPNVIENTYLAAINDVADFYQSIFYRALGPNKALELYGIPTPKEEKGMGWFCSLFSG